MAEKDDYFEYVANVLGVKSLYIEPVEGALVAAEKTSVPLLIAVEDLNSYSPEEKDLLEKMVASLKVALNKIKIVDLQTSALYEPEYLLNFVDQPTNQTVAGGKTVTTHSPRILVKNTPLKKQVWADLQKVIQYFST